MILFCHTSRTVQLGVICDEHDSVLILDEYVLKTLFFSIKELASIAHSY